MDFVAISPHFQALVKASEISMLRLDPSRATKDNRPQKRMKLTKKKPLASSESSGGSSCHQCKSRRNFTDLTYCTSNLHKRNKTAVCRKKYCDHCLKKFYKEASSGSVLTWRCPSCRGICCCAACRRLESREKGGLASSPSCSPPSTPSQSPETYPSSSGSPPSLTRSLLPVTTTPTITPTRGVFSGSRGNTKTGLPGHMLGSSGPESGKKPSSKERSPVLQKGASSFLSSSPRGATHSLHASSPVPHFRPPQLGPSSHTGLSPNRFLSANPGADISTSQGGALFSALVASAQGAHGIAFGPKEEELLLNGLDARALSSLSAIACLSPSLPYQNPSPMPWLRQSESNHHSTVVSPTAGPSQLSLMLAVSMLPSVQQHLTRTLEHPHYTERQKVALMAQALDKAVCDMTAPESATISASVSPSSTISLSRLTPTASHNLDLKPDVRMPPFMIATPSSSSCGASYTSPSLSAAAVFQSSESSPTPVPFTDSSPSPAFLKSASSGTKNIRKRKSHEPESPGVIGGGGCRVPETGLTPPASEGRNANANDPSPLGVGAKSAASKLPKILLRVALPSSNSSTALKTSADLPNPVSLTEISPHMVTR